MGFVWASIGGKMYGQAQHAHQAAAHAALRRQQRPLAGGGNDSKAGLLSAGTSAAAAAGAAGGSSKGSAAAAARSPSPIAGSGGGVVITAEDDGPPPNTPHTIALDPELRQAAAGAVAAEAAGTGAAGSNAGTAAAAAAAAVHDFLLALAVCNTVVPTATDQGHLLYQVGVLEAGDRKCNIDSKIASPLQLTMEPAAAWVVQRAHMLSAPTPAPAHSWVGGASQGAGTPPSPNCQK